MTKDFFKVQKQSKRNIVLHNVYEYDSFKDNVRPHDILFFDDCTYEQYQFILSNRNYLNENELNCVVAFSTNIYREENEVPLRKTNTAELHRSKLNNGFMTITELKKLIGYDNVFLALHGHNHFNPEGSDIIKSMMIFSDELDKSLESMQNLNLYTDIFVYPHDYIVRGTESLLYEKGFRYIYPSQRNSRIYIEDLQ